MNKKIIFITGCQRSGTTLMGLVLNAHPDIHGVDENEFQYGKTLTTLIKDPSTPDCISVKLPSLAHDRVWLNYFEGAKILWMIRDPRATVASMLKLKLSLEPPIPWAAHTVGGIQEISNAFMTLAMDEGGLKGELKKLLGAFLDTRRGGFTPLGLDPVNNPQWVVSIAALCWLLKIELLESHRKAGLDIMPVFYEQLVSEPKKNLDEIVDYLRVDWHDYLLDHGQFYKGIAIGKTDSARNIDTTSRDKWRTQLDATALQHIRNICGETARRYGYDLGSDISGSEASVQKASAPV